MRQVRAHVGVLFCLLLFGVGCGSDSANVQLQRTEVGAFAKHKVTIRTLPWRVASIKKPHTLVIYTEAGSCSRPRILRTPARYIGTSVYILAEVAFEKIRLPKNTVCAGVGKFIYKSVRLKYNLDKASLYDASTKPPARRWPE